MADKGTDIACAIDALATWYKQRAAMITFTLPHDKYMSCADSYEILMGTWRMFSRAGKTKSQTKKYTIKSDVNRENKSFNETYNATAYRISKRTGKKIKNGMVLPSFFKEEKVMLLDKNNNLLAIYKHIDKEQVKPYKMF